jgi:hypothetical protein
MRASSNGTAGDPPSAGSDALVSAILSVASPCGDAGAGDGGAGDGGAGDGGAGDGGAGDGRAHAAIMPSAPQSAMRTPARRRIMRHLLSGTAPPDRTQTRAAT